MGPKASDLGFPSQLIKRVANIPSKAYLTGNIPKVKDQGAQGSCTAHGSCSMGERLYSRWQKKEYIFSPSFTYYLERQKEGTLSQGDCGAQVSTSLQVPDPKAGGVGWCPLSVMPYDEDVFNVAPNQAQLDAAKANPGGAYHTLGNNIENIKLCILSDYSFVIGINVYDSFESDAAAETGLIPFANINTESLQGGHEVHAGIVYDDSVHCPNSPNPGAILVENSWGTGWGTKAPQSGERGFAWISYDYIMSTNLTTDIRMGHLGSAW